MKRIIYLLAVILLASCHSKKKVEQGTDVNVTAPTTTTTTVVTKPSKNLSPTEKLLLYVDSTNYKNYTAKVHVALKQGNRNVSTSGSLKMRWNEVIQISLVDPVLGIAEVGRLEFSKDDVLVVDRINKQYVRESYDSISKLARQNVSYEYVQALFWSEAQKKNNDNITYKLPLKQPVTLNLQVSNVGHKDSWEAHYEVSSRYKKVSAEELFKSLSSL